MWKREILEEIQPKDPYKDGRVAVWPDQPVEPVDYIIIGEAPGKTEVKQGQVFCGRSGQLLREVVADYLPVSQVHYTNTSLFRPATGKKDKPPTAAIWKQERPRLLLEISMLKPKAVICVGTTAAEVLCGNVPRMRGMVREVVIHGRTYLVYITHHPAFVTYEPDVYCDVVEDFQRAAILEVPERFVEGTAQYVPGTSEPFTGDIIAIDTESDGTYIATSRLLTAAVADDKQVRIYTPESLPELGRALQSFRGRITGHNSPFDEQLLRQSRVPIVFTDDSLLLHYSQDERKGSHRLKVLGPTIAKADTGIDIVWPYTHGSTDSDDEDTERVAWKDIPLDALSLYCGRDAGVTRTLHLNLELPNRHDERTKQLYVFLQHASRAFTEGMVKGVRVDRKALVEEAAKQEEKVAGLLREFDFNPLSQPQTLSAFQAAGYDVDSVARDVLRELEGDLPRKMEQFREQNKLLTGFLRPLLHWTEVDERVHPSYKLYGTDSGRTSCADPNLQQVPPELRHLFIAAEGCVFAGWDFRTHEVRGIALLSKDRELCRMLQDPKADPHQIVADRVGLDRQTAKHSLFGVAYGAGEGKLVKTHGISPEVARKAIQAIRKLFPGLSTWREAVVAQMYGQGYVETPYYHRRRYFLYVDEQTAPHQERVAVNFLPQSLCGDVALDSAVSVYEELGLPPLIFVHDFNAVEVPEGSVERTIEQCREIASAIYPNDLVRFIPDMYVGKSWAAMKEGKVE